METILIVDDEKNYLVVLEALLGPEGYDSGIRSGFDNYGYEDARDERHGTLGSV
jgi:CheY-like chemotaxis protein